MSGIDYTGTTYPLGPLPPVTQDGVPMTTTTTPHVLSRAELDALPLYAPVQCSTDFGRPVLAMKIGRRPDGRSTWRTTDGATYPDSFTISHANPILLVPAGGGSGD